MAKYSDKIERVRNANTPFKAWKCLITGEILDNIFQHANRYILIFQHDFSRESYSKLTDNIKIKAFVSLLCLAGALLCYK